MFVIAAAAVLLAGCQSGGFTAPPSSGRVEVGPTRKFVADYDEVRPPGDRSSDENVVRLGNAMCGKLSEGVSAADLVHTLAFDKDGQPTGMTEEQGRSLLKSAVTNLCPYNKEKIR
jgi:hypothetical protein